SPARRLMYGALNLLSRCVVLRLLFPLTSAELDFFLPVVDLRRYGGLPLCVLAQPDARVPALLELEGLARLLGHAARHRGRHRLVARRPDGGNRGQGRAPVPTRVPPRDPLAADREARAGGARRVPRRRGAPRGWRARAARRHVPQA